MVVLYLSACPSGVRGDVTKWLMEIATGIYVGNLSLRAREALWERICKNAGKGHAVMICPARNEQGFTYYVHNTLWQPVDFDGLTLMRRPLAAAQEQQEIQESAEAGSQKASYKAVQVAGASRSEISKTEKSVPVSPQRRNRRRRTLPLPYETYPADQPLPRSFIVLDTETTGLDPEKDQIIELACVKVQNGLIVDEFECLIQCAIPLPEVIHDLTGITNELLDQEGIPLADALKRMVSFCESEWIVGHNVGFDISFILKAFEICQIYPMHFKAIDTVAIAKNVLSDTVPNCRLETLARHYEIAEKQFHRALPDAQITTQLYLKLNENPVSKQ